MEVLTATAASTTVASVYSRTLAVSSATYPNSSRAPTSSCSSSIKGSLSGSFRSPFSGCLNPGLATSSKAKRSVATMVIPFSREGGNKKPPPDLASYLLSNRIVYLGLCLTPEVQELIAAELMFLQLRDDTKPVYLYINSTGTTKDGEKLGYEQEALSTYDFMEYIKPPVFTLCVGNAWGEAALLLAAGARGNRSALPSSSIMIRQPMGIAEGQASDVDTAKREMAYMKKEMVNIFARHTKKSPEEIEADIGCPKYFNPAEAVEYGLIDKVYSKREHKDRENSIE